MIDGINKPKEGFRHRIPDFLGQKKHEDYILLKHQELERTLGKSISHAEFMRRFLESQPDFAEKTQKPLTANSK